MVRSRPSRRLTRGRQPSRRTARVISGQRNRGSSGGRGRKTILLGRFALAENEPLTKLVRPLAKGQITLPAEFRRRLKIGADTLLSLTLKEGTIEIVPLRPLAPEERLREYGDDENRALPPGGQARSGHGGPGPPPPRSEGARVRGVPRLFLDVSLLIAAAGSSTGASALVLEMCRHGQAQASRLTEADAVRPSLRRSPPAPPSPPVRSSGSSSNSRPGGRV